MLVNACANRDEKGIMDQSLRLKLLSGAEDKTMLDAHLAAAYTVGEPFQVPMYNFSHSEMSLKVQEFGSVMLKGRLISPPTEIYTIHRKVRN